MKSNLVLNDNNNIIHREIQIKLNISNSILLHHFISCCLKKNLLRRPLVVEDDLDVEFDLAIKITILQVDFQGGSLVQIIYF